MGEKDQEQFENDELDTLGDFDDTVNPDEVSADPVKTAEKEKPYAQERINARQEIERRNELKALKSELEEWDDLLDEDDL